MADNTVWVFGGGIAGLTAAHELAERGYKVHVVEPSEDSMRAGRAMVGGVAKTQWALLPNMVTAPVPLAAEHAVPVPRVYFHHNSVVVDAKAKATLKAYVRAYITAYLRLGSAAPRFNVVGFQDPNSPPGLWKTRRDAVVTYLKQQFTALWKAPPVPPVVHSVNHHGLETDGSRSSCDHVDLRYMSLPVPGEHGFRYFPGFYKHVFDTMRRTPLAASGADPYEAPRFSVFDNLVPTKDTWLAMEPTASQTRRLVRFPRTPPKALRELYDSLDGIYKGLGYTERDVGQITLKIFQYMTTGERRRKGELEDIAWWDFIDGDKLSALCAKQMSLGPEILGAMSAQEADARTQGNCVTQLLMDQMVGRDVTDATLNGPTSVAWFNPWRQYLEYRGVRFHLGRLKDFTYDPASKRVLPVITDPTGNTALSTPNAFGDPASTWFVLAAPLPELIGERRGGTISYAAAQPGQSLPLPRIVDEVAHGDGLAQRFARVCKTHGIPLASIPDFEKLVVWSAQIPEWNVAVPTPDAGPLRHLNGIQYYFASDVEIAQANTMYLDSDWRISSVSQVHFWRRPETAATGYRGIISVDIGALQRSGQLYQWDATGEPKAMPNTFGAAWVQNRAVMAATVWRQVLKATPTDPVGLATGDFVHILRDKPNNPNPDGPLHPIAFHVDECLAYAGDPNTTSIASNSAPYIIERPHEYSLRPGNLEGYAVSHGWVLAGTHMKTYTRLTTMEAANESGRHAANAVLKDMGSNGEPCEIWNPEVSEVDDLRLLKELDNKLYQRGLPHFVEILGLEQIERALLP